MKIRSKGARCLEKLKPHAPDQKQSCLVRNGSQRTEAWQCGLNRGRRGSTRFPNNRPFIVVQGERSAFQRHTPWPLSRPHRLPLLCHLHPHHHQHHATWAPLDRSNAPCDKSHACIGATLSPWRSLAPINPSSSPVPNWWTTSLANGQCPIYKPT